MFPLVDEPDPTGSVEAKANQGSFISSLVQVGADSDGRPTVDLTDLECSLQLDISVSGSDYDWLIDLLKSLFGGSINSQICTAATGAVQQLMENTVDPTLAALNMTLPFPVPAVLQAPRFAPAFDVRISSPPLITDSSIAVATRAEVIVSWLCARSGVRSPDGSCTDTRARVYYASRAIQNANHPPSPRTTPPDLPEFDTAADHMLSAEVATWTFDRLLATFQEAGVLNYTVEEQYMPPNSLIQLKTNATTWKLAAPALHTLYPNDLMDVVVNITNAPTLSLASGSAVIDSNVTFAFRVLCANQTIAPAFTLACPLHSAVNISISGAPAALHANFTSAQCSFTLVHSSIGSVHATMLSDATAFLIDRVMLPYANKELSVGFPLPSYDNLTLADPELIIEQGTIFVDANLKWTTPPTHSSRH